MLGRTSSAPSPFRSEIIHDRINPCIANEIKVWIFINNRDQIFLCIPAVTENNDMFFAEEFRHDLTDHGSCQFQFRFFFLPNLDTMVSSTHRKAGCVFHYTSESSVRYFFMKKVVKWCYLNNTYKKMELSYYNSIFQ